MKKCSECNVEMVEGLGIRSEDPVDVENNHRLYIVTREDDYYARRISHKHNVRCRICPNCGKVELFINPEDLRK